MSACCDRHAGKRGRCQELAHGLGSYKSGCRCDQCREVARRARARWRNRPVVTLCESSVVAVVNASDWRTRARIRAAEAAYPDSGSSVALLQEEGGL